MMKKFLLLILMCVMGGVNSQLMAQEQTVTIGTIDFNDMISSKTVDYRVPIYNNYEYSVSQQIYTAEEIDGYNNAKIKKIAFKTSGLTSGNKEHGHYPTTRTIDVYMRNVEYDNFGAGVTKTKALATGDLVFSGNVTFTNNSWVEVVFNENSFTYEGNNILVCVNDRTGDYLSGNYGSWFYVFEQYLYDEAVGKTYYRALQQKRSNSAYNPTIAISAVGSKNVPQIQFTFAAGGTQEPTPPTVSLTSPANEATGIFNPSLKFNLANADQYQIQMAEGTNGFSTLQDWTDGNGSISYQTNLLKPSTAYSWKVVAKNDDGETTSDVYTFTTKAFAAPGALTSASPADGATDLINPKLEWTFGADTEEQQLIIDDKTVVDWTNIGTKTNDSYQTSGLTAGEHTWQVNVRNGAGETTGTTYTFTVASLPDNVTPVSPADGATGVSSNKIKWQFAENTTEYRFLYSEASKDDEKFDETFQYWNGTNSQTIWFKTEGAEEMEIELKNFETGKTYYWAVDVKNSVGERTHYGGSSEYPVNIYSFTTASTLAVSNTAPVNGATNLENPVLGWNYVGNAQQYQVYLGTDENYLPAVTEWTAVSGTSGSYQTSNLIASTEYFWRVDVKDEGGNVIAGKVWSFVTTLPAPTNVVADPVQIVPTLSMTYGSTTISWDDMSATGYNVYLGTTKLNAELIEETSYEIAANTMKLSYNMGPGYDIYVEAVYSLGTSISEAVNVKVTGTGYFTAQIASVDWYHLLAGATVTLTCTEDEFGNVYENGEGRQYTFTTNAQGYIFEEQMGEVYTTMKIYNGTYAVLVEKDYYESFEGSVTILNGQITKLEQILTPNGAYIFTVTPYNATFESIDVYIDASVGQYYVYLKNGETTTDLGVKDFVNDANSVAYFKYDGWSALGKGNYQFGVARAEDQINWSTVVERNYDVFETEGSWSETANWRDKELPGENAEVYVLANATIAAEDEIAVGNINIKTYGSLTINGSLTANNVYNAVAGDVILNDGAQLRQGNNALKAKFVMNIINPTDWSDNNNITGWQFIASPFTNAAISNFTTVVGDYDLFKFDGTKTDGEWVNHKTGQEENGGDEDDNGDDNIVHKSREAFETTFVNGRGYLASYESATTATLSGTVNNATTHTYTVAYDADNKWTNFHLLGNPFTFDMDWNAVTVKNMIGGYAIINENGSGYEYFTEGTIKVGDAFFVKATDFNPTISYGTSKGQRDNGEKAQSINVIATSKAGKDNVVINFVGKSEGFDKLQNFDDAIAIVFVSQDDKHYGIANVDENVTEVELSFVAKQMGNYSISFDINGEFETVTLVDRITGVETDMIAEGEYNFIATSEDASNRFVLKMVNGQQTTDNSQFVYQSGEELILSIEGIVQIIDMMGRVIYSDDVESTNNRINVSAFNNAAYIVKVDNENGVKVQKIVL